MMTNLFIATMSFSCGLLAFCAGSWLTVWSTSNSSQYTEANAAKITGYFVTIMAIVSLIFTSYYMAQSFMNYSGGPRTIVMPSSHPKMTKSMQGKHTPVTTNTTTTTMNKNTSSKTKE